MSTNRRACLVLSLACCLAGCAGQGATGTASLGPPATASASADPTAPAEVPAGFPIMPRSVAVEPLPTELGLLGRWTSAANGSEVYEFFVGALPAAGFRIVELLPGGSVAVIRLTTSSGAELDLELTADGEGTRIDLCQPDSDMW